MRMQERTWFIFWSVCEESGEGGGLNYLCYLEVECGSLRTQLSLQILALNWFCQKVPTAYKYFFLLSYFGLPFLTCGLLFKHKCVV